MWAGLNRQSATVTELIVSGAAVSQPNQEGCVRRGSDRPCTISCCAAAHQAGAPRQACYHGAYPTL